MIFGWDPIEGVVCSQQHRVFAAPRAVKKEKKKIQIQTNSLISTFNLLISLNASRVAHVHEAFVGEGEQKSR